ncbi:MAG: hypothetical protein ACHQNE_00995 [Candidatus Kapaibacterium sp.]
MDSLLGHSEQGALWAKSERSDDLRSEESLVEQIKVYYDNIGKTLTIWFRDPSRESVCEDIGHDAVMMMSDDDEILGFEMLNVEYRDPKKLTGTFEVWNG